jgi:hypothetical protein
LSKGLVKREGLRLYRRPREPIGASSQAKPPAHDANGAIAQLGERFNGIEEVVGSIPSGSTTQVTDIKGFSAPLNSVDMSGACAQRRKKKRARDREIWSPTRTTPLSLRPQKSSSAASCFEWVVRLIRFRPARAGAYENGHSIRD